MKSLSYLFAVALLLSTSPLTAMDAPVVDDSIRKPLPKLTGKVFGEFLAIGDNPFEYDEENGNAEFMTGPHSLKGKMILDDSNLNQFAIATKGVDLRNYMFAMTYQGSNIICELEHIFGRPKKQEDEKLILAQLPKILFRAVSQPKAAAAVDAEGVNLTWLSADRKQLRLRRVQYHPDALLPFQDLTVLDVSQAKNCPNISSCTKLTELVLGAHADTTVIPYLPKLSNLSIFGSSTIPDFSGVPNLEILDVSYNRAFLKREVRQDLLRKFPNIEIIQDD